MKSINLNIDLKETFKRLDSFILIHNDKVKQTKEGSRIGSNALSTAKTMLRMYFKHLQNASRKMVNPGAFKCNNVALATKMQYNKSTAFRHVTLLLQAGVISHKIWHGTNSGYEIHFNTELLVAEQCPNYTAWLIRNSRQINKNLAFETELKIKTLRPPFSTFPNGHIPPCIIENCNHTETVKLLQEQNINITVNTVDKMLLDSVSTSQFLQEQGSCETGQQLENPQISPITEPAMHDLTPGGGANQNAVNNPFIDKNLINRYVVSLYQMALNMLWENRVYDDDEHETAQRYLEYFLTGGKKVTIDTVFHRKSNFITRILLVKKYIDRSPDRYVVNPALYFNPNYSNGFTRTKSWHETVKKQQQKNSDYHSHIKILITSWNEYLNNPTIEIYQKHRQKIGKMRNTNLMNLYNKGILSPDVMTHDGMRNIRNEHYSLAN